MKPALGILLLTFSLGCSQIDRSVPPPPQRQAAGSIMREKTRETMEEIAIAELSKRQGKTLKRSKLEVNTVREGDNWQVTICSLPAKPGSFSTVILSNKGELKAIVGGE